MKKLICSFVITLVMGLSVNAFAQKAGIATMAYLSQKTSKTVVDDKTALVTFKLNNISDATIMNKYKNAFGKFQKVKEVKAVKGTDNMATYTIKMEKEHTLETLQSMFVQARIGEVNIDGKVMPTKELTKMKKDNQAAKATKK